MPADTEQTEKMVELDPEEAVEVDLSSEDPQPQPGLEIEDTASEEVSEEISEEELANYSVGVRKRIDKLTAKYREAERREHAALDYAKGVKAQNETLQHSAARINRKYGEEYAGRVTTDLESAKQKYVTAYENGDPEELVAATTELSRLTVENAAINNEMPALGASQVSSQISSQISSEGTPTITPTPDPKSQAWAQRNNWFGVDEPMTYTAFSIHKNLIEQGFDATSDDYYSEIDRRVREEFPHKFGGTQSQTATNGGRSPVQRVASANRAAKSTGRDIVKLTPSQVAIAKKLGVPLEEYARQVKEISANV